MKIGLNHSMGVSAPKLINAGDPDFDSVVLLVNAETGIVDLSKYARTLTLISNTAQSSAWAAQGVESILFGTAGDGISYASSAELDIGLQDFTAECTIKWTIDPASNVQTILSAYRANTNDRAWFMQYAGSVPDLRAVVYDDGTSNFEIVQDATFNPVIETEYALAMVRFGRDLILFVNGVEVGRTVMAADFDIWTSDQLHHISGLVSPGVFTQALTNCHMDEVRLTIGVARYTGNYDVATDAFPTE